MIVFSGTLNGREEDPGKAHRTRNNSLIKHRIFYWKRRVEVNEIRVDIDRILGFFDVQCEKYNNRMGRG